MIRIDNGGLGTVLSGLISEACEVAKARGKNAYFLWNATDLVVATPTSTADELRRQLAEREALRQGLTNKFRLEKRKTEEQEELVRRGLEMAVEQNAKVTIISGDSWLELFPWIPIEIAQLEWQARLS